MLMPSTPIAYPQVVSRRFAYFRVVNSDVSAGQAVFCRRFDSRQLHQRLPRSRWISELPPRRRRGPLGDVGFIGPRDCLMTGREASSACRWVRVVDYALQRAAIARHWAQHALARTDAQAPRVRRAPLDVDATCLIFRRLLPVLADSASTCPTSPL